MDIGRGFVGVNHIAARVGVGQAARVGVKNGLHLMGMGYPASRVGVGQATGVAVGDHHLAGRDRRPFETFGLDDQWLDHPQMDQSQNGTGDYAGNQPAQQYSLQHGLPP